MPETGMMEKGNAGEFDFTVVFYALWRRRGLIIIGTIAATLLAVIIGLLTPNVYRSEGFYQLGNPKRTIAERGSLVGVPIPVYKNSSPQFFNPNRLQLLAGQSRFFSGKEIESIKKEFRSEADISRWISPIYAFSRADLRELGPTPREEMNSVIGMKLWYESDSPKKASAYVRFFGSYIRDCLMDVTLYNYIMEKYSATKSELHVNENSIMETKFALLQNARKLDDIRAIMGKYPESARIENRQLVSVQDGGGRFLAPVTQLVGIESDLANQRRQLAALERNREILAIQDEYFSICRTTLDAAERRGEKLFLFMKSIRSEVFKEKDLRREMVKVAANNLSVDLLAFDLVFFTDCRFISGPTVPVRHSRPQRELIAIIAFLLSALFFTFLAVLISWWQKQGRAVTCGSPPAVGKGNE